ncbi:sensor histidine kinase [Lewinella sp. IMCC34183]|uniref:sensor histidine kinase n=1 Tax=Lewinella sp. IMCC34183 TaxID=2248762 RepID=UPI000E26E3AA|nr:sensor histidine kinase [Lewinella sp. IMCC34183]
MRHLLALGLLLLLADLPGQSPPSLDTLLSRAERQVAEMTEEHTETDAHAAVWEVLRRARAAGDPARLSRAHALAADWHFYSYTSELPDSFLHYDSLRVAYILETTDTAAIAQSYHIYGNDLAAARRYRPAEVALLAAVRYFDATPDPGAKTRTLVNLANLYRTLDDPDRAAGFLDRAARLATTAAQVRQLEAERVSYYLQIGRPDSAVAAGERLMSIDDAVNRRAAGLDYARRLETLASAYSAAGQTERALELLFRVLALVEDVYERPGETDDWKPEIGLAYHRQGDHARAVIYLRAGVERLRELRVESNLLEGYARALSESYAQLGQPDSAMHYLNLATAVYRARTEERLASLRSELRVRYAIEEKDALIGQQADRLAEQRHNQQLTLGIAGLLLLGAAGLLFGLRHNRRKNALLEKRNAENELLVKEIHHRVKNNLEVISSLLELQSATLEDPVARRAMLSSQRRVATMGLLHQRLYQGRELSSIEMRAYLTHLTRGLVQTYGVEDRIELRIDVPPLEMDVDTAVPLGLIVNELVTNSIKYAFPGAAEGLITVALHRTAGRTRLVVEDTGAGGGAPGGGTGFGSRLVGMLTQQLGGRLLEQRKPSFRTEVTF